MADFNVLTMNARCFPGTASLVCKKGDRVRIRLGNLSAMDHHPIHIHGMRFKTVATDGGPIPTSAQHHDITVLVPVGTTRTIEFLADAVGDWAFHCHMTHHAMNQMGHGTPNMIGVDSETVDDKVGALLPGYMTMGQSGMGDMASMPMAVPKNSIPMEGGKGPFGDITMGGMFTLIKVRETLESYDKDPGFYRDAEDRQAKLATSDELHRDGIDL